jgi:uncharacterized membrane protein YoaK (UPF0700 family)
MKITVRRVWGWVVNVLAPVGAVLITVALYNVVHRRMWRGWVPAEPWLVALLVVLFLASVAGIMLTQKRRR